MRRHRVQMSSEEIHLLESHVRQLPVVEMMQHAYDRMLQKRIEPSEVSKAILLGDVIEIHNDKQTRRVLLRHQTARQNQAVCVVVDIDKLHIVTAWVNQQDDTHRTLDLSAYRWSKSVHQILEEA